MLEKQKRQKEHTELSAIKKLYDAIIERNIADPNKAALAVGCLERIAGCEFKDTKDFFHKIFSLV